MPAKRRATPPGRGSPARGPDLGGQMLARAIRHHQAGHLSKAERTYRRVLRHDPRHADALNLLGVVAVQLGKPDSGIDYIGRALRVDGANPVFHYNLGLAYQAAGNRDSAITSYRRAVELKPDYSDALTNLGNLLLNKGEAEEAEGYYRKAVRLAPENAMAHNNLGSVLLVQKAFDDAAVCFREALRLEPDYAEAHNGLGATRLAEERNEEAAACLAEALRLQPDYARAHNNLGLALGGQGRFDDAVASFRAALALEPDYAEAHLNLGQMFFEEDRLEEAEARYRDALRLKPDHSKARIRLAKLFVERDEFDAALEIYQKILDASPDSVPVLVGKAGALQRMGDFDAAYAIVRPLVDAGPAAPGVAALFGELSRRFDCRDEAVDLLEKTLAGPDLSSDGRRMLHFALGSLYDGLDAFDDAFRHYAEGNALRPTPFDPAKVVAATRRWIDFFSKERLARLPRARNESDIPVFIIGMPRSGTSLVEQILDCHPAVFGAGELSDIGRLIEDLGAASGKDGEDLDDLAAVDQGAFDQAALDAAAAQHLDRLRALGGEALRVTDKMPYNFQHLPLISLLFPRARVIHCVRDPLDTCLSCYFQNFARGNFHAFDLRHVGLFHVHYQRLMRHWRAVLDIPMLEVRYEEHVAEPERVAREMLDFLGLEWDPRCLRFHESKRVVKTASRDQVRRPIYTRSAGRWRHYEHHLGPLKEALAATD